MRLLILISLMVIIVSCQNENSKTDSNGGDSVLKISKLNSDKEKSDFLYNLWQEDQKLRQGQYSEILIKYGRQSEEFKEFVRKDYQENKKIFLTLKSYLELYGYPENREKYHSLAINAFPTIIGHFHSYEDQKELFLYLYEAYKIENCTLKDVVWVLGEMYESKNNGKRYKQKSKIFTYEQEFIELSEVLGLGLKLNQK